MKTISNKEFLQKIKNNKKNILIFGKAGMGTPTTISEYMKNNNIRYNDVLTDLYNILYPQKHTHIRKRISYKYGKHAYKKEVR